MNEQVRQATAQAAPQMGNTARAIMSIFLPIAAIVGALLFVGWILALFSLITQHNIFGWGLPHGMPLWVGILVLVADLLRDLRAAQGDSSRRPPGRGIPSGLGRAARPDVDRIHRAVFLARVYLLPGSS